MRDKSFSNKTHRFRFIGLRGKLLLVTVTLFIFPLAGFSYLKELEHFLKSNHADSVQVIAKTIATTFKDNASLNTQNRLIQSPQSVIYSHPLKQKILIDGYSDDWFALQNVQQSFVSPSKSSNARMSILCSNDSQYYYFLVTITNPVNNSNHSPGIFSDIQAENKATIHFKYLDYARQIKDFQFNLKSPGWINGYTNSINQSGIHRVIRGEWQSRNEGYTLEFKVPMTGINNYISFELSNDSKGQLISTAAIDTFIALHQLNPVISTDPLSTLKLKNLVPENTKIWLLNKGQYVNAHSDVKSSTRLDTDKGYSLLFWFRRLYLLLMNYPEQRSIYGNNQVILNNSAIQQSLQGLSTTSWLDDPHSEHLTLSVTTPVFDFEKNVIGVLLLEQENNSVLALQDKTFERILLITIILFFGITVVLFYFSSHLLNRIINLRNDTEKALSHDGEIANQLYRNDNDEIGDLARSFSTLLGQVDQNHQYLKTLSSKLSHELRTPLSIIKSSLENLDTTALSKNNQKYSTRAKEGCSRLNDLLNRMSEASRLEQSINTMKKESIDIVHFLRTYVESIDSINPDIEFIFNSHTPEYQLFFSPELMAQLLDKLITNAISFHEKNSPIRITLHKQIETLYIEVNNMGPLIDQTRMDSIFNSLTSYREKSGGETHLGLGLYVARLIANYHQGELQVKNNSKTQSVSFFLKLKIN